MTKSVPVEKRDQRQDTGSKMSALDKLNKDRAVAKGKVTSLVNSLKVHLTKEGAEAQEADIKVDDDLKKLDTAFKAFKAAHVKVCEAVEETETDEKKIEDLIKTNDAYLNQVKDPVYEIGRMSKKFSARLKLPAVKENLLNEFGSYKLQREELVDNGKKVAKTEGADRLHIPLAEIRTSFNKAYVSLVKAQSEFKRVCEDLGLTTEAEVKKVDAKIPFGVDLNQDHTKARNEATTMVNLQEDLREARAASPPPRVASTSTATPIKLAKADAISFSGEPRDFPKFKIEFNDIVVPNRDDQEIGLRLKQALPKRHSHVLDNFSLREHVLMMKRLEEHFGTSEMIVCSIAADIKKLKMPTDAKSFVSFVDRIEAADRELRAVNLITELANESSLVSITEKFPKNIATDWGRVIESEGLLGQTSGVKFERMMKFLSLKGQSAKYAVSKAELSGNTSSSRYCVVTGLTLSASASESDNKSKKKLADCLVCSKKGKKADHLMSKCNVWINLPFKEKEKLVTCIKHPFSDHTTEDCPWNIGKCGHCGSVDKHNHLMCDKLGVKTSATKAAKSMSSDVLLKTMIVEIGRSGKKAGLMEDNGSTDNYVTKEAVAEHKFKKEADVLLQIEGINSTKTIDSAVYRVPLMDTTGKVHNIECYALDEITEEIAPINSLKYGKMCSQLNIRPGQVKRPVKIDILLSSRSNFLMSEKVRAEAGGLKLYQGPLGLTISGSSKSSHHDTSRSYPSKVTPVISTVKKAKVMRTLTDKQILQHFKEESIGAECSPRCGNCQCGQCALGGRQMSLKEERDYKLFKNNLYLDEKGTETDPGPYWRTSYPWKIPKEELIDNKPAVMGMMKATERKLSKDKEWRDIYEQQLRDLVTNKFAREVSDEELRAWQDGGNKSYYISHQMALNPASKSTPIRTVFNSSQVYKGYSLNSSWELGPDVTGNMHGILMRFREGLVGAQGDVKKMYYNIRVTEEEEYMQLFIWKFRGEDKIRTFAMTRLVMGNKPSANCSQVALKETAYLKDNNVKFPAAAEALSKNSYVDNTFTVDDNLVDVDKNIKDIEMVAAGGGFYYKPWVISGQEVGDQMVLNTEDIEDERALGVMWSVKDDVFYIKVGASGKLKSVSVSLPQILENPDLKLTLRACLSLHAKAFDPHGLILPVKVQGNLLFRKTLQAIKSEAELLPESDIKAKKMPWDCEISGNLKLKWLEYFEMLKWIENVKFPRSIKPPNTVPDSNPSLVTFSDGNEDGYGCVAYALWDLNNGSREARLIMAKAKLAPLLAKGEVVKNELSGATFAVRLKTWIIQNTNLQYDNFIPFIDSRIVQAMIKKDSYEFNTFVGLRVKEIDAKSDVTTWHHVSSADNYCSDILTRGENPTKLGSGSPWQCGPAWLTQDPDSWPVSEVTPTKEEREIVKSFEKVTKTALAKSSVDTAAGELHHGPGEDHILDNIINYNESLEKIINVVAIISRLRGRIGVKFQDKAHHKLDTKVKCDSRPVTALEHKDALKLLISHVQKDLNLSNYRGFNLETIESTLESGKVVKLVILRSRVQNFPVKFDSGDDFVYLLPKGTFAKRIAKRFHQKHHRDVDTVVTMIKREFWIPQLRKIVSKIDKDCGFCLIKRQKVSSQLMGSLPLERSLPSKPFLVTTLDLFGPITIKDACVKKGPAIKKKAWGVLFSCAAARAVQLDVADDYSTQSILHCVRRLKAERGEVMQIISDPGTQLRGAAKELKDVYNGWDKAELIRYGAKHGFEWNFVMANSQHQNGVTEVLVKLVKGIMKALMAAIGTTVLNLNELFTLMKETQNLANERPIGLKPNSQTDPQFLSPNSLLLGRCSDRISAGPFQSKRKFDKDPESDRTRFLLVQKITNQFWRNWMNLYFPTLLRRQKWHFKERNLKIGDVCVMKDSNALRGDWKRCRVSAVSPDKQGNVRNVKVLLPRKPQPKGPKNYRSDIARGEVDRHVSNLIVIVPNDDDTNDDNNDDVSEEVELEKAGE